MRDEKGFLLAGYFGFLVSIAYFRIAEYARKYQSDNPISVKTIMIFLLHAPLLGCENCWKKSMIMTKQCRLRERLMVCVWVDLEIQ